MYFSTPLTLVLFFSCSYARPVLNRREALSVDLGNLGDLLPTATFSLGELLPTGIDLIPTAAVGALEDVIPSGTISLSSASSSVSELTSVAGISGLEGFSNITDAFSDIFGLIKGDLPMNATDILPAAIEFFANSTEVLSEIDLSASDTDTQVNNALDVISGLLATTTDFIDVVLADNQKYDENQDFAKFAGVLKSAMDLFVSGVQTVLNNDLFRMAVVLIVKYTPVIIQALAAVA